MDPNNKTKITVQCTVNAPLSKVWNMWNDPQAIMKWNNASDDWHTTSATVDLRVDGEFTSRMEAKDGSFGFDFKGIYSLVEDQKRIEYAMEDGRAVQISFEETSEGIKVKETFDAEETNPIEMQQMGWQSIMDNFKKYVEQNS